MQTVEQLEALRFCNVISGRLEIAVNNGSADFSALYDISEIQGLVMMIGWDNVKTCMQVRLLCATAA